jgi:hypothetical protein
MILDSNLEFTTTGSAQAITTTAASTNVIDLVDARDMGIGDDPAIKLLALVGTAFTTDTTNASTLTIQFQGSTDSTTYTTLAQSTAYGVASLAANGKLFPIDVPALPTGVSLPRYLRLNFSVGVASFATGSLQAFLVLGRDDIINYPKNYNSTYPT